MLSNIYTQFKRDNQKTKKETKRPKRILSSNLHSDKQGLTSNKHSSRKQYPNEEIDEKEITPPPTQCELLYINCKSYTHWH